MRAIGLRAGLGHPLVLAALEDMQLALAAGGAVGVGEFLLRRRQHVVVELALHDEKRAQRDLLAALEYFLRVALVDRLPRLEVGLARLDELRALHLLRLLPARVGVA